MNDLVRARLGRTQDDGGHLAARGRVKREVVEAFLAHPYFHRMPPKSLDRNDFAGLLDAVKGLSTEAALATLTAAAASAVAAGPSISRPPCRGFWSPAAGATMPR